MCTFGIRAMQPCMKKPERNLLEKSFREIILGTDWPVKYKCVKEALGTMLAYN